MILGNARMVFGVVVLAALLSIGMVGASLADEALTGSANVSVPLKPTQVLMFADLTGQGETLAAAVDQLNGRFKQAKAKLDKLGAQKDSVELGPPSIAPVAGPNGAVSTTVTWSSGEAVAVPTYSGPVPAPYAVPPPVASPTQGKPSKIHRVKATLTARWPLADPDPQKILLAVEDLREKLTAADVLSKSQAKADQEKLSAEAREILEEMENSTAHTVVFGRPDAQQQGDFMFAYVGEVTAKQRQDSLRNAFSLAKKQAAALAEAAHVRLGSLTSLSDNVTIDADSFGYHFVGEQETPQRRIQKYQHWQKHKGATGTEIIVATAAELSYQIGVTARFAIAK